MRHAIFMLLGFLEVTVALVLLVVGQLVTSTDVPDAFTKAEGVARQSSNQVKLVRQQIHNLRRPELQSLAQRLQEQTRTVTTTLQSQQVDFETIHTLHDALGEVATGLETLAGSIQPDQVGQLSEGLGETAAFLERVVPATTKAADDLEKATSALHADARNLTTLLKEVPLDLKTTRDIHDSLARFGDGLDKLDGALRLKRLGAIQEGFEGMQTALTKGADQVEKLGSYTYPVVTFNGLTPEISERKFWPEGEAIAKGLRQAAGGIQAASKEMDGLARELPQVRSALEESRKIVGKTREALALTLKQQDQLAPLLKEMPLKTAQLAEQLPALGKDVAQLLRGTDKLQEVARALRQAQQGMKTARERWPEPQKALTRSANLLRSTRGHLQTILDNPQQYEAARQQAVLLGEALVVMVPLITEQLNGQLQDQDQALDELGQSIDEVSDLLPVYGTTLSRLLRIGRLLAWLVAGITGLHGVYLMLSARMGRRYSV
jgi:chromosome segregation ATPase